jgi:arylsulfatase
VPAGGRFPQTLQVSDIAPTLLEAAGLPAPPAMEGKSFWKVLAGVDRDGGHDRVISLECTWQAKWSLRTSRYKFILAREPDIYGTPPRELYDLAEDPREERNIAAQRGDIAGAMEAELEEWIADRLQALGRRADPLVEHGISLRPARASQD